MFINWFEIPASNMDRAIKFYGRVFNVSLKKQNLEDKPFAIFQLSGENTIKGAIVQAEMNSLPASGAVLFFTTTDMTATIEAIIENGGKIIQQKTLIKNRSQDGRVIIPKTLIDGNMGYFAYFTDSEGNKMGLYSNS